MLVIMMSGNPATGKTTLARNMYAHMERAWMSQIMTSLEIRKSLNLFHLDCEEERNEIYKILAQNVRSLAQQKRNDLLIVDANFNKRERRELLYRAVRNCIVYVIECLVADERIIKERLEFRKCNQDISENKAYTWDLYKHIEKTSNPVELDEQITSGEIGLIRFDSGKNEARVIRPIRIRKEQRIVSELLLFLKDRKNFEMSQDVMEGVSRS